jgi:hypothetical protein
MTDNIFSGSNPDCDVTPVPKVDFHFIDDCRIQPTPPPISRVRRIPPVTRDPFIRCPYFYSGDASKLNVGYCVETPAIIFTLDKDFPETDPCSYKWNIELDIPLIRPPCPEISVENFCSQFLFVRNFVKRSRRRRLWLRRQSTEHKR